MYCKHCGELLNNNQAICIKCGVKVGDGDAYCANCGQPMAANAAVCMSCGAAVNKNLNGQDKIVLVLLCIFLGWIGIHNFMMGETKKGVFKIITAVTTPITCGVTGIVNLVLVIIDLVKICKDTYVIDPNKLI